MSDDKAKKVKIEGTEKLDKEGLKEESVDEEDLDAIFGDEDDSVRLSKTKLEGSKSQLDVVVGDGDDDEELEDDDS
ncbi:unnamed protein product [Cylindrotheca closterium]|uniref:Uncharacterized protein n=1 Tax=Cylindrotheca closterium TaxID=2856 RepID=A0AAD2FLY3_9STRA|nr:unnamed protein product [Cylindrotheca closterium]